MGGAIAATAGGGRPTNHGPPTGFLSRLPRAACERLVRESIRIDVAAGTVIYRNDERPRVIVVLRGLVRRFLSSLDGRQMTVSYARSGDVAGLPLVVGGPGPVGIQAMTRASVLALPVDTLRRLIATDPSVSRVCAEELTRQLYRVLDDLSESAFLPLRQRLVRQLLDLAASDEDGRLVVRVSHEDLAEAVASVREVVTRALHELRDEGLIEISRGEIVLIDPIALERDRQSASAHQEAWPRSTRPPVELVTERLILRQAADADLVALGSRLARRAALRDARNRGTDSWGQRRRCSDHRAPEGDWSFDACAASLDQILRAPNENRLCLAIGDRATPRALGLAELLVPNPPDGVPWIGLLFIEEPRRNLGLGSEALAAIERHLAGEGWLELRLNVDRANLGAQRFWARHGFVELWDTWQRHDGLPPRMLTLSKRLG